MPLAEEQPGGVLPEVPALPGSRQGGFALGRRGAKEGKREERRREGARAPRRSGNKESFFVLFSIIIKNASGCTFLPRNRMVFGSGFSLVSLLGFKPTLGIPFCHASSSSRTAK